MLNWSLAFAMILTKRLVGMYTNSHNVSHMKGKYFRRQLKVFIPFWI